MSLSPLSSKCSHPDFIYRTVSICPLGIRYTYLISRVIKDTQVISSRPNAERGGQSLPLALMIVFLRPEDPPSELPPSVNDIHPTRPKPELTRFSIKTLENPV
jgi:hypothetical protein